MFTSILGASSFAKFNRGIPHLKIMICYCPETILHSYYSSVGAGDWRLLVACMSSDEIHLNCRKEGI
jgi:hypothetical protein